MKVIIKYGLLAVVTLSYGAVMAASKHQIREGKAYFGDNEIVEADVTTFVVMPFPYARDANYVYSGSTIIEGADPATAETLGVSYLKDKNNIYFTQGKDVTIPYQSNTKAFNCYGWAAADSVAYYSGKKTEVDSNSLRCLVVSDTQSFAADNDFIYRWGKPVQNFPAADITQVELLNNYFMKTPTAVWNLAYSYDDNDNEILVASKVDIDPAKAVLVEGVQNEITDSKIIIHCAGKAWRGCKQM